MRQRNGVGGVALSVLLGLTAACADSGSDATRASAEDSQTNGASGGATGSGGSAGSKATGGSTGSGGSTATGGTTGSGGSTATGGGAGSGGATGTGGSSGTGGSTSASDCSSLNAAGSWQKLALTLPGGANTFTLAADPLHAGTVYVGANNGGIWKSTDCGSTWAKINTGTNGSDLDSGMIWALLVNPGDGSVYSTVGYGKGGVYKSTDGGISWRNVLPANIRAMTGSGFVEKISFDPTDAQHLTVSFHHACDINAFDASMSPGVTLGTGGLPAGATITADGWACLAESHSGGEPTGTGSGWTVTTSALPWEQADGVGQTMYDSKTWFYGVYGYGGIYRTTTGGVSPDGVSPAWKLVSDNATLDGQSALGGVYISADRKTIFTGQFTFKWSDLVGGDIGATWTYATSTFNYTLQGYNGSLPIFEIGSNLIFSAASQVASARYFIAPLPLRAGSSSQFQPLPTTTPESTDPAISLDYDSFHRVLYAVNFKGAWRYPVPSSISGH